MTTGWIYWMEYIEYYNQKKHQTTKKKPNEMYHESICRNAA